MLLHELEDRTRILERRIGLGVARGAELVAPARLVVTLLLVVPAGKEAVFEREALLNQERGIRVQLDIVFLVEVVRQNVIDQPAEKGNVGPRAYRDIAIGDGGGAVEARVDGNQPGLPGAFRLYGVTEADGMILGRIAPHYQNHVP